MEAFHHLIDLTPATPATATGREVYDRFEREPDTLVIAVVDGDGAPVGLVERNAFFVRMAAEYGRALYAGRPISVLMDREFLVVDHEAPTETFCREVLNERPSALARGFVVVRDGRYLGVGTALSLLRAATEAAERRAEDMARTAERLALAEAEAQAAARAKSQFLGVMSHELRTPLNGVIAVAEMRQRSPLNGHGPAYVQTILDSSQTLLRILNDTIDLSRADAGELDLAPEPCRLEALMDDVQAMWLPRAQQDGVRLNVAFDGPEGCAARVDAVRLKQVLNNLIGNALKFTRQGGVEARLEARAEGGTLRLRGEVRDTGPGIPPEALERIFEPFVQDERGVMSGGAGLGLAICRRIIEAMDGRLWARSNAGAGATFGFEFEAPVAESLERAGHSAEAAAPGLKAHLLIVDDNSTNRMVAETLVNLFGCTCETVVDGVEAVEAARARRFDAVLMDIKMPRMDGVEATVAIRGLPAPARGVPIIALTANADPDDARGYLAAGMALVVEKPIKAERLFEALAAVLAPDPALNLTANQAGAAAA